MARNQEVVLESVDVPEVDAPESDLVAVRLRFGGAGVKRGDVLNVSPDEAARLSANGSAFPVD